jgi:DNA-binding PadR family transcriptional regulator
MNKLSLERVLRALSSFDSANVEEVSSAVGHTTTSKQRLVWSKLQRAVADGHATRTGDRGHRATYSITDSGRAFLAAANTNQSAAPAA